MRRTCLYRIFDSDTTLLYVGIAYDPLRRLEQHRSRKPWANQIAFVHHEWYEDRPTAAAAELVAIRKESPKYNVHGKYDDERIRTWEALGRVYEPLADGPTTATGETLVRPNEALTDWKPAAWVTEILGKLVKWNDAKPENP